MEKEGFLISMEIEVSFKFTWKKKTFFHGTSSFISTEKELHLYFKGKIRGFHLSRLGLKKSKNQFYKKAEEEKLRVKMKTVL